MGEQMKYPIGEQDFKSLRLDGNVYIDKTDFIYKIAKSSCNYFFLARPRRFGKSLFLSTLRYFFEGRRELFQGLYIDSTDWNWEAYPVLRLDLNTGEYWKSDGLNGLLEYNLSKWEKKYSVEKTNLTFPHRFSKIIEEAHRQTGKQVVILVDEYDKPLVRNLHDKDKFENFSDQLASIYSNFKSSAEHIRLVFLTGVSRFSRDSIFAEFNNINDITFDNAYADICGITEKELLENFQPGIQQLAQQRKMTYEEACEELKVNYNGYRFAELGNEIYNPWSVLNCLSKRKIDNYWNETGKPTIIAEALKNINADLEKSLNRKCTRRELRGLDIIDLDPTALLYQTGYITIKDYNAKRQYYQLGLPNKEVKEGLFKELLPHYLTVRSYQSNQLIVAMIRGLHMGDPGLVMKALLSFFDSIDYSVEMEKENNFHNAFFLLFHIIGLRAKVETYVSEDRIDIEIANRRYVYVIELKYDHSAEEALKQIEEKHYARKYQMDSRKVFLIGASFSSKTRCIESWKTKTLNPQL